ncbi:DUF1853 family protein [Croceitalea sp. P059]|uniref:DUF1853 family protein n=1 Tax=Croceitalea sp. P059 TaxID=3075601 RepID=UPI002888B8DC|nr:DUF1853 family protein [Croceitalea sp. P059]MDT0539655.1 DUF1853 family protein [Croceitalea sp. P059]
MNQHLCLGFYKTKPLWVNEQFGVTQFEFPDINFNNFQASPIPERLRLGHKMEHVFEQFIEFSNEWELLAKNLLVDKGNLRVGELDFLVRHEFSKISYHIELAYKFYIINPEITEPIHRLMGPNRRDMFYTKLDKLKNKQFPLLFNEELHEELKSIQLNLDTVQQQACFKAQLFSLYGTSSTSIRPLNKNCIEGRWIRFDDFSTTEFNKWEYYLPFKQEWVMAPSENRGYVSHYNILLDINLRMLQENAPMLWIKKSGGILEKLFVVWW